MRMVINTDGMFSRGGKPIISVPHISDEISKFFEALSDNILLDGEIYNHDLKSDFNKLISYAKKTKPKAEDLVESEKYLQYHIYDFQDKNDRTLSFKERSVKLRDVFTKNDFKYLKFVETTEIENDEQLNNLYGQYLEDGYEGQMVRASNSVYENDRSKSLLKRKEFIDEEFKITNITEGVGNRSGMMGRIELIDKFGITFESGCRGNHDYYKELLLNKSNYIGKSATVRFQNKTPDSSYRFPVVINIAREDYE
jgi:DNA ligase-1